MKKSYQQKSWFLIGSMLLHTVLFGLSWTTELFSKLSTPADDFIEVTFVGNAQPLQQIVEQDEVSVNEEKPDNAKFLSAKDQKVNQETQAKTAGAFNNQAGQQAQQPTKATKSVTKKKLDLADLSPDSDWFVEKPEDSKEQPQEQAGRGPAKSNDYLKEVKSGAQTLLNTREFVYYSYYTRIRNQLQQYWEPSIKVKFLRLMKSGRNIASSGDKLTKVLITLNKEGTLVKVQVLEESGVRDLDEAAIEAFQQAAPFPNPPDGIIEQDGTIKIRWDFVVEA
jgi:TonB family protein